MSTKLIYLISLVVVLGLVLPSAANAADPDLVGWWKFDEMFGTTARDSSGKAAANPEQLFQLTTSGDIE